MAMAWKTTTAMAMAMTALLLLGVLCLLPGAAIANAEASMPALLAHIREIQRLSREAHGEDAGFDQPEQPDQDFAASLGLAESSVNEPVGEEDGTNGLFAHMHAVQRKTQEAMEDSGRLNGEERSEVLVEGTWEGNLEEELEERDGEVDALVQKRFDQLDAASRTLNDENDGESVELSADGGEGGDAINPLHQIVQERQQESEVQNDRIREVATGEHEGIGHGYGNKHGDHEHFHGRDRTDGDAREGMDALVLERFNQLEAVLKILNEEDGVAKMQLSAGGGEGDDAINLLHHFVQERQQKRHQESQLEIGLEIEIATSEHEGIGRGHGSKDDEKERFDGHDYQQDLDGGMDALVLERFNQLEAALKILNKEDGVERMQLSAGGGEGDDAINLLHHFVQERQQKRHQDAQLENDRSPETTTGEHEGIGRGRGSKHDEHGHFDGDDYQRDPGGGMDARVFERFNQLEAALKILNDRLNQLEAALEILNNRDGVERTQLSADGGESDDAINLLHRFVQERQQQHGGLVV